MTRLDVSRIRLDPFFTHKGSDIVFPDDGVVLFTGLNGAGKSAIIEAIAWCCWGMTLRGTKPDVGSVLVEAELLRTAGIHVQRVRKAGKTHIEVRHEEMTPGTAGAFFGATEMGDWRQWENSTKAQAALVESLGDFDTWRRSAVFSSVDPATFFLSPDATRKQLLDELLDLAAFDRGLESARSERRALEGALGNVELRIAVSRREIETLEQQVTQLRAAAGEADANLQVLEASLRESIETADKARSLQRPEVVLEAGELDYRVRALQGELSGLGTTSCPTCKRLWGDIEERNEHRAALQVQLDQVAAARRELQQALEQHEEAVRQERAAVSRKQALMAQIDALKRNNQLSQLIEEASNRVLELDLGMLDMEDERTTLRYDCDILRAAESVLGLKGLRATLLDRFLHALQNEICRWLIVIGGGKVHGVELQVDDRGRIQETLHGIPDPKYKAASGGERRRVDAAFILALSTLVASNGVGTVFFDEVFDALDVDGVAGVARALHHLAQDRAVICVSHSRDLVEQLSPDVHYHVEDGRVLKQ